MDFTIKQLVGPSDAQLEAVSSVLAVAFANDEFTAIVLGRDLSLVYDLCHAYVIATSLAGKIHIAESDSREIIGSALWFEPGRELFDSEDQQELALTPLLTKLPPGLREWWRTVFVPQYDEIYLQALGPNASKNSFNLQLLGTIPEARRKGVARALIDEVRTKAAGALVSLEAESEDNVRIYEKFGFQVRGDCMTFSNESGSFPMWVMASESS